MGLCSLLVLLTTGAGNETRKVTVTYVKIQICQVLFGAIPRDSSESGFGASLALSADGRVLAAGGRNNDLNDDVYNSGHVRVFIFLDNSWLQLGDDVEVDSVFAHFGTSVALLFDGLTLAVGSPGGVDAEGNLTGCVRLHHFVGIAGWMPIGNGIYGRAESDKLGRAVALTSDGSVVVAAAERYARAFQVDSLRSFYLKTGHVARKDLGMCTRQNEDLEFTTHTQKTHHKQKQALD